MIYEDVPLRTRRALSLYKVYGDSAPLVLNGTLLNSVNALLALGRLCLLFQPSGLGLKEKLPQAFMQIG